MKYRNKNFCEFNTRRSSFTIGFKEERTWGYVRSIATKESAQKVIDEKVKKAFSLVGGNITE